MGKGKKLNREEKHQVQALSKLGTMSSRQIAVQVGVSPSSVQRVLKRSPHITNVKAGRKEKLDDRQKRALTRYISKNPTSSAETAKRVLNFPCSAQTVRRMLHKSQFAIIKMIKEKGLSKKNQEIRVNFARDHVAWIDDWQRVIFSDEKKWNLTGPDGWARMWVQTGRNTNMAQFSQMMKSIMVWGAISASGPLVLVLMKGKYDSRKYIEMIDTNLFSAADSLFPANSVFQQDNAPIRVSKHSLGWLGVTASSISRSFCPSKISGPCCPSVSTRMGESAAPQKSSGRVSKKNGGN